MNTQAQKFNELARAMQKTIDEKNRPRLENTRRRAEQAASIRDDARKLERLQNRLYALAAGHENETLPDILKPLNSKTLIDEILRYEKCYQSVAEKLEKLGINPADYNLIRQALLNLGEQQAGEPTLSDKIRDIERHLIGVKMPGYFPTPPEIVKVMLHIADIQPGDNVLEPSAGNGNIADAIREWQPAAHLSCVEIRPRLREILSLKGHSLHAENDFLQIENEQYDVIVMNPPFEMLQDIDHVFHAYKNLKAGGRIVSVMSESGFFRQDKKSIHFRRWLENLEAQTLSLPPGAFAASGTNVKTRLVTIDKPCDEIPVVISEPAAKPARMRVQLALPQMQQHGVNDRIIPPMQLKLL